MASKICRTISGASPSEGSSSSSRRGRLISARAIASICCSPPDSVPPRWSQALLAGAGTAPARARDRASKSAGSAVVAPICRFSSTVMRGKMRRPSGACASLRRAISWVGRRVMSRPAKAMLPSRARGLPQMVIISVDLPAPLAPIRVTISPSLTSRSTPLQRHHAAVEGLDAAHREERRVIARPPLRPRRRPRRRRRDRRRSPSGRRAPPPACRRRS